MEQQETLKRKLDSTKDIQSVVKTMQSLAAVNIKQYEKASVSVSEYSRAVEYGFQILMKNMPEKINIRKEEKRERCGVIIFGASQGLSGDFNDKIMRYALSHMRDIVNPLVMAMGERMFVAIKSEGIEVKRWIPISGSFSDITPTVQEMVVVIQGWNQDMNLDSIIVFHNQRKGGASVEPVMVRLFPIEYDWLMGLRNRKWNSNSLPMFTMEWDKLFSSMVKEYFSVTLYRAFFKSLEAENASRLASMQAAQKNIEERLEELTMRFNQQRQQSITSELMDIIAGFESLTKTRGKSNPHYS